MSGIRPAIHSANDLRKAFEGFFASKAHTVVPSASLIPHDPTVLFTVAGMVPFKPYFVGDEAAPFKRAVTVQKCTRAGGKHNDLDEVGRTKRHLVFFEMMGNFSFGDYFKSDAIPWAWELVTEVFGFDGDRLWITVHESDDEAEQIWHEVVGVPMNRIQRLGDEDNFWQMGDAGPCGPCSEIHIDRGPAFGPEGGPLHDPHGDRYMEFWNLVFMQYNQSKDGSRTPLPKPSIDTGAGLERILALMQGTDSVWETDVLFPMIESAQSLTSKKYKIGDYDDRDSFSLRVLAEHARSSMMLVNDGVFPSNENRGYVLRRIIRRAVRHAYLLGTEKLVMPTLAETAISVMSGAYPDLLTNKDFIVNVLSREEERFRQTLKTGLTILESELSTGAKTMSGTTAFTLHDTYGFPIELTQEIAGERSVLVDVAGFGKEMQEQRDRAKSARKGSSVSAATVDSYREVMEQFGTTNFVGYVSNQCEATVLAVLQNVEAGPNIVEVFLDVSPFYAESGGQVGDTGTIRTESGELKVLDTMFALPGLRRHTCSVVSGSVEVGQSAKASINVVARDATRRNHTATHMLHWALRQVLGDHVKQAGSHVSPERLRFDFSHYAPVSASEIEEIERLTNVQLIANDPVRVYETSKDEVELCGGTHVGALGDIGMVKVVAESSIGSNLRRIEAVTGTNAVEYVLSHHRTISAAASLLGAQPSELVAAIQRKIEENKSLGDELKALRSAQATSRASEMVASAEGGVVVSRVDGVSPNDLRELALAIRQNSTIKVVVLGGVTDTGGVALVATVSSAVSVAAGELIRDAAKAVGGGGGGKGDIATAGGKDPSAIDAALQLARSAVTKVLST